VPRGVGEAMAGLAGCIGVCEAALGSNLTAYVSGAASASEFAAWADDDGVRMPAPMRERIGAAVEVVAIFAASNQVGMVRAWLREYGAAGASFTPAGLIRAATSHEGFKQVYQAAADFVAQPRQVLTESQAR